jgi:signal transduction histidine kinase
MILHDIDRDIAMARSLRAIVDTVLKHIRRLIPCWRANVILYEPDTDEIVVLASEANGETAVQPGMRFPAPAGWANRMLTEHYNIVEDTHTLPEPISPVVRLAIANGTRSFISTSLLAEGNLIGALALGRRTPAAFAAEDIEIASDVANQLAIAIHQARLKEQIERYAAELEEKVAQRTAELRDINAELETFAYSVSHDLKAPLRGIDGYGRLLLQDYADKLDEDGRTFLYTIRSATQQMNQLIDDLLTYSRLERRAMTTGSLNPRLLVEMLIAERADELNARQVTPSVDIPCGTVTAEAEGLVEALRNLLENALKFTRDVPAPRIEIGGRETDKTCILWVRDNGIGFDMQYHDRIFEIFQRLHRAEDYPGTGIGLAIVRKVMQRMGGRVWAESTPGQGATFFLEVPK